jgi:hypothetical protein
LVSLAFAVFFLDVAFIGGGQTASEPVQQGLDFAVACQESLIVSAGQPGLSARDFYRNRTLWTAFAGRSVDVGPSIADDAVVVIADNFHTVYGFSKGTGQLLWRKEHHSNVLASDGRYFYIAEYESGRIAALDSRTGSTEWEVKIPDPGIGYFRFLRIGSGFLYTDRFAVDVRIRTLANVWPEGPITVIAFPKPGETLLGDSKGRLSLLDSQFRVKRRMRAGDTPVAAMAANEQGILVSLEAGQSSQGVIEFLTWNGKQIWQRSGLPGEYLRFVPFVIAGESALILVPESAKQWRFESRNLLTGKVNWEAPKGNYYMGSPVICGDTVFLRAGQEIARFRVEDGQPLSP